MVISTIILGWIGILIFFIVVFTYQKLMKNNEFALLHILFAMMYAMWLPLPLTLNGLLKSEILQVGTIFGCVYLLMLVMTMTLQAGHISYIVKHNEHQSIMNKQADYMMATLSSPFEAVANVFKCIWALFLGIAFWNSGAQLMAYSMFLFKLPIFYYGYIVLIKSLNKPLKFLSKVQINPFLTNLETGLFFIVLISNITLS